MRNTYDNGPDRGSASILGSYFGRKSSLFGTSSLSISGLRMSRGASPESSISFLPFWIWFRTLLPLLGPLCFLGTFGVVWLVNNTLDGYILSGACLSFLFGSLAIISYIQVFPWRRHPSSLMMYICLLSLSSSAMVLYYASPLNSKHNDDIDDDDETSSQLLSGSDLRDGDSSDQSMGCQASSFMLQFLVLGREMWILTLSLDLLMSITNPFSSYKLALQRYHTVIWMAATIVAIVLVTNKDCQGEFLSNGTCWLKVSGLDSVCLWSFYLAWIFAFYFTAITILAYALKRIHKGLESTYATRFACVADTLRVVVFYFFYGVLIATFLSIIRYAVETTERERNFLEHIIAYLLACRGFIDSMIWFATHRFVVEEESVLTNMAIFTRAPRREMSFSPHSNVANRDKSKNQKEPQTLRMSDIIEPWRLVSSIARIWRSLTSIFDSKQAYEEDDSSATSTAEGIDTMAPQEFRGSMTSTTSEARWMESPLHHNNSARSGRGVSTSSALATPLINGESDTVKKLSFRGVDDDESDVSQLYHDEESVIVDSNAAIMDSSRRSHAVLYRTVDGLRCQNWSEADVSPQLNMALREEVLYLVTLGIKESVLRSVEREKKMMQFYTPEDLVGSGQSSDTLMSVRLSNSHSKIGAVNQPAGTRDETKTIRESFMSTSQAGRKMASNVVHSLMNVVGAYKPGEYGIDPINTYISPSIITQNSFASLAALGSTQENDSASHVAAVASSAVYREHPASPHHGGDDIHRSSVSGYFFGSTTIRNSSMSSSHRPNYPRSSFAPINADHYPTTLWKFWEKNNHMKKTSSQGSHLFESCLCHNGLSVHSKQSAALLQSLHISQGTTIPTPPAEVVFQVAGKHTFRDFRPATFHRLRQLAGVSSEAYLETISQPTQEHLSEGRSGAFFFICGNGDLIVKTVESHEAQTLLSILDSYVAYLVSRPESLLVRFLGLHSIQMYGTEFTFVVMKNAFPPGVPLSEKYDIKGSWVNRSASVSEPGKVCKCRYCGEMFVDGGGSKCPEVVGEHEAAITLKDNDMISKIRLYPDHAYTLIDTILSDSDALTDMGLMDYSLLVGVRFGRYDFMEGDNINTVDPSYPTGTEGFPARVVIAPKEYYFGVIDILQTWSWKKRLERLVKVYILGQNPDGISCICPDDFRERFQRKITCIVEHAGFAREVTGSWVGKREIGVPFPLVEESPAKPIERSSVGDRSV